MAATRASASRWLDRLLVAVLLFAALVAVVVGIQLLVLLVLGRLPTGSERAVLAVSALAAVVAALAYQPLRAGLERFTGRVLPARREPPGEMLRALSARLSRATPLDELLLELAESLRRGLRLESAEIWTGSGGLLERAASAPDRGWGSLTLAPSQEAVVARAGVSGPGWLAVWLPELLDSRGDGPLRVAPLVQADELLGLVVVERPPDGEPFGEQDERVLAELARQAGLALRNIRLDSQLRASLDEVRRQADELRASRARVVTAADAERRRIERDLHDGAQQRLIALMVNLRLARELAGTEPAQATEILAQLGDDLETAVEELRELAHGIYPPLLAGRGLAPALSAVAARGPIAVSVQADARSRYPPPVEATVYFCCLEALQNAGKHAGAAATATVRVWEEAGGLLFEVADDGSGFDPGRAVHGAGLENMTDRLGAIGGSLRVASSPGHGVRITGTIPLVTAGRTGTGARP
jgi:signal transduction histidine kinase